MLIFNNYYGYRKVGSEANSSAVIANAWQHRSDANASIAVFIGLVGSMLGYPILDPAAGVLVAGLIIKQVSSPSKYIYESVNHIFLFRHL